MCVFLSVSPSVHSLYLPPVCLFVRHTLSLLFAPKNISVMVKLYIILYVHIENGQIHNMSIKLPKATFSWVRVKHIRLSNQTSLGLLSLSTKQKKRDYENVKPISNFCKWNFIWINFYLFNIHIQCDPYQTSWLSIIFLCEYICMYA